MNRQTEIARKLAAELPNPPDGPVGLGAAAADRADQSAARMRTRAETGTFLLALGGMTRVAATVLLSGAASAARASSQCVEQQLGLAQVGKVEALGKPRIDRGQQVACLRAPSPVAP
jgi:hypothetical protein